MVQFSIQIPHIPHNDFKIKTACFHTLFNYHNNALTKGTTCYHIIIISSKI